MKYSSTPQEPREFHVPPGDYDVRVIAAIETVSKTTGTEMIKLTLEVEGHGCRLYDYLVGSPAALWRIDAFRRAIGETVVAGQQVDVSASELVGRCGRARLRVEEYEGKLSNRVDLWLQPQRGAQKAPKPQAAKTEEASNEPF